MKKLKKALSAILLISILSLSISAAVHAEWLVTGAGGGGGIHGVGGGGIGIGDMQHALSLPIDFEIGNIVKLMPEGKFLLASFK